MGACRKLVRAARSSRATRASFEAVFDDLLGVFCAAHALHRALGNAFAHAVLERVGGERLLRFVHLGADRLRVEAARLLFELQGRDPFDDLLAFLVGRRVAAAETTGQERYETEEPGGRTHAVPAFARFW